MKILVIGAAGAGMRWLEAETERTRGERSGARRATADRRGRGMRCRP